MWTKISLNPVVGYIGCRIRYLCLFLSAFVFAFVSVFVDLYMHLYFCPYLQTCLRRGWVAKVGGCGQRYRGIQWLDTQVAGGRAINTGWQGLNPPLQIVEADSPSYCSLSDTVFHCELPIPGWVQYQSRLPSSVWSLLVVRSIYVLQLRLPGCLTGSLCLLIHLTVPIDLCRW